MGGGGIKAKGLDLHLFSFDEKLKKCVDRRQAMEYAAWLTQEEVCFA